MERERLLAAILIWRLLLSLWLLLLLLLTASSSQPWGYGLHSSSLTSDWKALFNQMSDPHIIIIIVVIFSEKSLDYLSLSSTDHTKIMSFFVCPIMFSIPFFWRLERIFFSLILLADFSETKDLFSAAGRFWKYILGIPFFENAVTILLRNVYFYHTYLTFLKIPIFIKEIIIWRAQRCELWHTLTWGTYTSD